MPTARFSNGFSLTEEIANIIRERILKGEYRIGEKIKENQISEELKVSRTPIREAFKQLESEGLIESIPNRGSFARGFTKRDVQDIYAVRAAVEELAMLWAAERITMEDIEKLQKEYDMMEFYTLRNDSKKVLEININFHEIIYSATGSRFLAQILKSYQDYVQQTRKATVYGEENLKQILYEHKEILDAIKERNQKKAVEKIAVHLINSQERAEIRWNMK